jgi:predicted aspartyl protease
LEDIVDSGATDHFVRTAKARKLGLNIEACEPKKVGSAEEGGGFIVTAVATARVFIAPSLVPLTFNVADGVAETLLSSAPS